MKPISKNKLITLSSLIMFALMTSQQVYAEDVASNNGNFTGFEQGKHKGHENENGKHKGHEKDKNPWSAFGTEQGIDFDLTIINHAISPIVTVTLSYNSKTTIGEVLADVVGDSTESFVMQDCYESGGPLSISDCPAGQTPVQLDNNLTLELAGLIENPKVHIVYILN